MQQRQRTLLLIFDKPEDEGSKFLSNAGNFEALHVDAGSYPRKFEFSSIPPRKFQTPKFFPFQPDFNIWLNKYIIQWNIVLLPQMGKKFPAFYVTRMFIIAFPTALYLSVP